MGCGPGAMPGPWISSTENPGFAAKRHWESGEIFECHVYDGARRPQGKALWQVITVGEQNHGQWMTATLIAVEDEHLKWWLEEGQGKTQRREFFIHTCTGETKGCRGYEARDPFSFHTDCIRMIEVADIVHRRASWWISGVAKKDFEDFRKEIVADRKREANHPGGHDDAEVFSLDDERGGSGAKTRQVTVAEAAVGEDLRRLKGDVAKDKNQGSKPRKRSPKDRDRAKDKSPSKDPTRSRSKSKGHRRSRRTAGSGDTNWFGKKAPKNRSSSSSEAKDKKDVRRKKRSSSRNSPERAKRRKKHKEGDRGPFGVGKLMEFEKDGDEASETLSDEEGFQRGAPDRRSHQLRLVEYSQRRPGRLASRLLVKMRGLLARDAGSPFNLASGPDLTPSTATSYLLTVMIPSYREKLGIRLLRELRTVAAALDNIACGQGEAAADILGQRMKAFELQMSDNGWQRAQYLELIAPEGAGLAEQDEQGMAAREQALEAKMMQQVNRPKPIWNTSEGKGKGDGQYKGKGKKGGKKGKWTPAEAENKGGTPVA